ncbi:MAG: GMC family oxidoreductase N-terminal domain-containing protein [Dehalococcoidia bacterium]|nr:GMC family oxidoreductase N-terminal domain-containing protein [Dehalococcoidia bacterium]
MRYDHIIIGAGSAGAILATRLSEDPNKSVLLLEAGPDHENIESLPEEVKYGYASTKSIWTSDYNWQYRARATDVAEIDVPRGKITGGSSAINGQVFLRGLPEDYDNWSEWGNDLWDFEQLLPYFNKIETDVTYEDNPGDFHGSTGPIICHRFPEEEWQAGSRAFVDACLDAGFPFCEDANAPDTIGVGPIPLNNPGGIRWSTSIGYLGLSRHRLNLTIRSNVTVKNILFDTSGDTPHATGVCAVSDDEEFIVEGDEVILSAGAIASPQILMLSGIGPADHLEEHGINVLVDSPGVGQNLRDHPLLGILWATKPEVELDPIGPRLQVLLRYTADGSAIDNDMIVYLSHAASARRDDQSGDVIHPVGINAGLGLNSALSQGEVRLNSADYREHPYLDYNLLAEEEDIRRYRDGVRLLVRLENHPAMEHLVQDRMYPLDTDLISDEALDAWIRKSVQTGHHVSCTAKMGPQSDEMAVVDQFGKVYGVNNLRVADASIMPECVRANINVTVMVIGERIASFILEGN